MSAFHCKPEPGQAKPDRRTSDSEERGWPLAWCVVGGRLRVVRGSVVLCSRLSINAYGNVEAHSAQNGACRPHRRKAAGTIGDPEHNLQVRPARGFNTSDPVRDRAVPRLKKHQTHFHDLVYDLNEALLHHINTGKHEINATTPVSVVIVVLRLPRRFREGSEVEVVRQIYNK
ncbi:uncharacterized protein LOC121835447 [Ixodes scapularis]|uniref:uncharacterized protein LOC121835447 n=1 Tax=Ixodes scapularis TaxID=6945 RepID=UPI001C3934F9|nr:uncharacterized protein LOC121835447 [Ixodes scapularis]